MSLDVVDQVRRALDWSWADVAAVLEGERAPVAVEHHLARAWASATPREQELLLGFLRVLGRGK